MDRFLSRAELEAIGFARLGDDVSIDRSAILLNPAAIAIGSRVRIDAFCLISAGAGRIAIGSNVHIATGVYLYGSSGIDIDDFANISFRSTIFSQTDDFSGKSLIGPTIPDIHRTITAGPVCICRHVIIGAGSIVVPGVTLGEGAATGAMSLVRADVEAFSIVAGIPARVIGQRSRDLLQHEAAYVASRA